MKLLYTKRSPFARKVRALALEKGINLELIDENLQQKSARLLEANPLGKVPTLLLDNGQTIYDSSVICQYLETLNNNSMMIPKDPQARIEILKWEAFSDDLMVVAINLYMEKIRHPSDFNKEFVMLQENNIQAAYGFIGEHLAQLAQFNLASVAVASAIGYIHFRLPNFKVQGKLAAWFEQINQRPSMQQTVPMA